MNPYEVLGVARDAAADVIKAAYRKLSRKYHPDVSSEPDSDRKMRELNEAWAILGDEPRRLRFDSHGIEQPISSVEHDAMEWVAQQFARLVDQNADQMVVKVRAAMYQNVANLQMAIPACTNRIAQLSKQAKRIAHKDGPQNLVHTLIESKRQEQMREIERMTRGLEILVRVSELLNEYTDIPDPAPPPQPATTMTMNGIVIQTSWFGGTFGSSGGGS